MTTAGEFGDHLGGAHGSPYRNFDLILQFCIQEVQGHRLLEFGILGHKRVDFTGQYGRYTVRAELQRLQLLVTLTNLTQVRRYEPLIATFTDSGKTLKNINLRSMENYFKMQVNN